MPDWKVLSGLSVFIFCATAFGLFMLHPEISSALDKWQTLATGFLAIVAAVIAFFAAVYAAKLQAEGIRDAAKSDRDSGRHLYDQKVGEDARRIAAAISEELSSIEISIVSSINTFPQRRKGYEALQGRHKDVPDTIVDFDPRAELDHPVFDALIADIGALPTPSVRSVVRAYSGLQSVTRRSAEPSSKCLKSQVMDQLDIYAQSLNISHQSIRWAIESLAEIAGNPNPPAVELARLAAAKRAASAPSSPPASASAPDSASSATAPQTHASPSFANRQK